MSHDNKTMANISTHLKLLLVISNLIAPYGLFLAFSITGPKSLFGSLFSLSAALLILFSAAYLFTRFRHHKYIYVTGVIGFLVTELIWVQFEHFQFIMVLFGFLLFSVLLRLQMVISSKSLSYHIGKEFRIDSLLLVLTIFVLIFVQAGTETPNYGVMNLYIAVVCIIAILLRLVGMLVLAREESETQGTSKIIQFILIASLVCLIATIGKSLFLVFLVAFILMAIPFIPGIRKSLYVIFAMIAVAFVFLVLVRHITMIKGQPIQMPKKPGYNPYAYLHEFAIHVNGSPIRFYTLLTVIGILVAWRIWRKSVLKQKSGELVQEQVKIVNRGWIRNTSNKRGLRFLPTQNPIRLTYQKWLKDLFKKGLAIQPFETPAQFYKRASESDVEAGKDLTYQYQEARYNMDTD